MLKLETPRLILRDYTTEDFEEYFRLKSDPKVMYYLQDISLHSRKEALEDFRHILEDLNSSKRNFYFFHIEKRDTHEPLGSAGYTIMQRTPQGLLVHAGYFMYPQFWHQGYMTEAFSKIIHFAFTENNVYRITTGCLKENVGSERVMVKCGMVKEAEHVDWEWHDDRMKTRVEYRLLRKEYKSAEMVSHT